MIEVIEVFDMNGVLLKKGQRVRVHQEDFISEAIVVDDFTNISPTLKKPGWWVDIEKCGDYTMYKGVEGMMSYILEVIDHTESVEE